MPFWWKKLYSSQLLSEWSCHLEKLLTDSYAIYRIKSKVRQHRSHEGFGSTTLEVGLLSVQETDTNMFPIKCWDFAALVYPHLKLLSNRPLLKKSDQRFTMVNCKHLRANPRVWNIRRQEIAMYHSFFASHINYCGKWIQAPIACVALRHSWHSFSLNHVLYSETIIDCGIVMTQPYLQIRTHD